MISYRSVKVSGDYNVLLGKSPSGELFIDKKYIDDSVIKRFNKYLGDKVSKVIIEWPYYDHDYLSTYYIHYSKKFVNYPKYCYRLHFISKSEEYAGYTILRPVMRGKKLGRTYIDPSLLIDDTAYLLRGTYKAHFNGTEYTIDAFPWMMQDTDITICAHISTWTILNYYGNKYSKYINPSMADIVEKVNENWGRKTPSIGLTPIQVSEVISKFGFYPIIRGGNKDNLINLLDETMSYVESGIPVIAMSESRQHAFSIVGHGKIIKDCLDDESWINKCKEPKTNFILHSRLFKEVYVMDDNSFPYRKIKRIASSSDDIQYGMGEISYVVVPLYSRMQLEYHEVYHRFIGLAEYSDMKWQGIRVVRIYITSSNALKQYYKNMDDISLELKNIILKQNMPRFVWCVDTSERLEYKEGLVSGKVIIDATAGTRDIEPWILMHDTEKIRYYDVSMDQRQEVNNINIVPYKEFVHNLDVVQPLI